MPVRSEPALLEREAERDALVAGLADARDGTGALVVLEGAGGIGKTRLLREAREIGERMGLRVLAARATELEADYPFGVVRQLFEPVVAAAEADRRGALLAGAARPAAPVVGIDLGSGAPPLARDIADPSFATLNALYWLVSNLAEGQPLLLVVDDAHWADLASLRFLRFLAPRLEDLPVMLACATRPPEPDPAGALVAALAADPAARLIRPRPLTAPAVAEFVRAALAPGADDDFSASCGEVTGGNPFLLRELLAELAAEGVGGTREDAPRVREAAPAGISRAAALRLARAAAPARALAHALAVLGDGAEPRHVGALAGLERDEVNAAADALAAAGIVEAARPLRFTHPIVRTAIHGDLPAGERAAAHERAARMLAAEGAEPEQVAIHLLAADAAGDSALAEILAAAGERAIERAAPEAAVRYLRRALAESPPPELRRRIVARLLVAGFRAADADALEGIDPMAELADDPAALVDAATPLSGWLLTMGRPGDVETVLLRAAATAAEHGDIEAAMLFESQRVTWLQHPPREAYDRLAPYADRVTPGSLGERLWSAVHCWWTSLALGGTAGEAGDLAWRAVASGEIFDELPSMPQGGQAILVLIRSDRFDAAEQAIERFADAARGRGAVPELAGAAYLRGELARARGDIATAAAEARAAVEAARQGGFLAGFPIWLALLVDLLAELDDPDAADAELAAAGMAGSVPATYWFTPLLFARGRLRVVQGRAREAVEDFTVGERDIQRLGIVHNYYSWQADAARALAAVGDVEEAHAALDRGFAFADRWGTPAPMAAILRARGLLAGGEEGLQLLRESVALLDGSASGLERMHSLVEYGAALRRAGRRADARGPLREALALARRGGAVALARRAADELAATGERVRPPAAGGVESLTPSERRVAAMAAEGQSNREIAQALFLTVKTVETHLSNAYRKLDIRSRRDLGAAMSAD